MSRLSELIIEVPDHWPKRHNDCIDPCDLIQGPCACGAWHFLDEDRVLSYLKRYGVKEK